MQNAMILDEPKARMMAREDPKVLLWILKEHTRPPHELFLAAEYAGQTQIPDAVPVLVELLVSDESALVREGAALGLTGTADPQAIAALEKAAKFDASRSVRLAAKDALDRDE
jgi:HEAT repeat protein